MTTRLLILGGTTEARRLAERLADRDDLAVTLSLAGRTLDPVKMPVPVRSGGFGGVSGLAAYLTENAVDGLIDATHPFAAQMSRHAAEAAAVAGVPLAALRRPAWEAVEGDRWMEVDSVVAAALALGERPRRAFLALGRQELAPFEALPQHAYLIRSVDPVEPPLAVPDAVYVTARGPFGVEDDVRLLTEHRIDVVVSKNAGGDASYAKIAAARRLGLPVIMVRRPAVPDGTAVATVEAAEAWVDHLAASRAKRGV
jgi:precorrin-6A/cobalt-precorrin-6A reductase